MSGQREAAGCPPWCDGDHDPLEHPTVHRNGGRSIPAIIRSGDWQGVGVDLEFGLEQRDGDSAPWVSIATDDGVALTLTRESAQWMLRELAAMLRTVP